VESTVGTLCLRAWPPNGSFEERLTWIHQLMQQARGTALRFIPAVFVTDEGATWVRWESRLWEVTEWMPGQADYHAQPSRARLEAACTALARLHVAWSNNASAAGACPAVQRRLDQARQWTTLLAAGWRPSFLATPVDLLAQRAWGLLGHWAGCVSRTLATWAMRTVPIQPCLADIWHDHVLFSGEQVTGLIDFGSMKMDHAAVDLARLLGSLVGDREAERRWGLDAYRRTRPLSWEDEALIAALDQTGVIVALMNWLRWLYWEQRHFEDLEAVHGRMKTLIERIERWA
jgi:homoserine kinase type II